MRGVRSDSIRGVRRPLPFVLVLAFGAAGCPTTDPVTPAPDGGPCTATLDTVAHRLWGQTACPDSFDAVAPAALCGTEQVDIVESRSAGRCASGPLVYLLNFGGTHSRRCFYDPTTRALVGAVARDDTPTAFCRSSGSIRGGVVIEACTGAAVEPIATACGDAGVDGGPGDAGADGGDSATAGDGG